MIDENRSLVLIVGAAALLHAVLGVIGLSDQSLWLDEVMSISIATSNLEEAARWFSFLPEQHPFYYLVAKVWLSLFGTTEAALRSLSLLFGVVTIPLFFILVRDLLGKVQGCAAALLLASSPFWLYYSQEGRMYTLLVFLVVWASILAFKEMRTQDLKEVGLPWAYWCVAIVGMYTHVFFAFVVLAHAVAMLIRSSDWRHNVSRALLMGFPVLVAYLPWLWLILTNMPEGQSWKNLTHVLFGVPYTLTRFAIGYGVLPANYRWKEHVGESLIEDAPFLVVVILAHAILFIRGGMVLAGCTRESRVFLASALLVPLLVPLALAPIMILSGERYFLVVLPAYLSILSAGIVAYLTPGRHRLLRAAVPALLLLATARAVAAYQTNPDYGKEQWREVVARIETQSTPGSTLVVVAPDMSLRPLRYYLKEPSNLEVVGWKPGLELEGAEETIWIIVTRLLDPAAVESSIPDDWIETERELYPNSTGIWLLRFEQNEAGSDSASRGLPHLE